MIRLTFVAMVMAVQKQMTALLLDDAKISFYLYKQDLLFDPVHQQHRPPPSSVS
jgi:hypothetical protein